MLKVCSELTARLRPKLGLKARSRCQDLGFRAQGDESSDDTPAEPF